MRNTSLFEICGDIQNSRCNTCVNDTGSKYLVETFSISRLHLKVLSSEMDLAEIRLIREIFIKGSVAEAFKKNPPAVQVQSELCAPF